MILYHHDVYIDIYALNTFKRQKLIDFFHEFSADGVELINALGCSNCEYLLCARKSLLCSLYGMDLLAFISSFHHSVFLINSPYLLPTHQIGFTLFNKWWFFPLRCHLLLVIQAFYSKQRGNTSQLRFHK